MAAQWLMAAINGVVLAINIGSVFWQPWRMAWPCVAYVMA